MTRTKAETPQDYKNVKHPEAFTSKANGNSVLTTSGLDYDGSETQCVNGNAQINDTPGYNRWPLGKNPGQISGYLYWANVYIKEAPTVHGGIVFSAWFDWRNLKADYIARSSDNKVNEKGQYKK